MRLFAFLSRSATLGAWGEYIAARHLKRRRYKILGRNVRSKLGEIDIVALAPDGRTLVIVEVKTRAGRRDDAPEGPRPEDALTKDKRARLVRLAELEAKRRDMTNAPLRIDVIAIVKPRFSQPTLRHHESAVTPGH